MRSFVCRCGVSVRGFVVFIIRSCCFSCFGSARRCTKEFGGFVCETGMTTVVCTGRGLGIVIVSVFEVI